MPLDFKLDIFYFSSEARKITIREFTAVAPFPGLYLIYFVCHNFYFLKLPFKISSMRRLVIVYIKICFFYRS